MTSHLHVESGDRLHPSAPALPVHIYLERLRSAHNVGSIMRTMEAFQLGTLYLHPLVATPDHSHVRKASMGSSEWVRWQVIEDLSLLPRPWIALETAPDAPSIFKTTLPVEGSLLLGNEKEGLLPSTLEQVDQIIQIPLVGRKNSLNVANAFCLTAGILHHQQRG